MREGEENEGWREGERKKEGGLEGEGEIKEKERGKGRKE